MNWQLATANRRLIEPAGDVSTLFFHWFIIYEVAAWPHEETWTSNRLVHMSLLEELAARVSWMPRVQCLMVVLIRNNEVYDNSSFLTFSFNHSKPGTRTFVFSFTLHDSVFVAAMAGLSRIRLAAAPLALHRSGYLAISRAYTSAAASLQYQYYYEEDYYRDAERGLSGNRRRVELSIESSAESCWGRGVHWVLIGDPATKKQIYAEKLSRLLEVPHISIATLLLQELNPFSCLYKQIVNAVNEGKLAPEDVIFGLLSKRLEEGYQRGATGFILDGIPRTRIQAEILDQIEDIDLVVNFKCAQDSTGRRKFLSMQTCGTSVADAETASKGKLSDYAEQCKALEDYYKNQKKLLDFQVAAAPGKTWQGLLAALQLKHLSSLSSFSPKLAA